MSHKIMVVDDDLHVIESLNALLHEAGFDVVSEDDGGAALVRAQTELPSLIILDLMLPHVAGMEICRTLKNDATTSAIPVIMLTGKTKEGDKIGGLEAGADDYITKPFNPRELVLRIHRALGM